MFFADSPLNLLDLVFKIFYSTLVFYSTKFILLLVLFNLGGGRGPAAPPHNKKRKKKKKNYILY